MRPESVHTFRHTIPAFCSSFFFSLFLYCFYSILLYRPFSFESSPSPSCGVLFFFISLVLLWSCMYISPLVDICNTYNGWHIVLRDGYRWLNGKAKNKSECAISNQSTAGSLVANSFPSLSGIALVQLCVVLSLSRKPRCERAHSWNQHGWCTRHWSRKE